MSSVYIYRILKVQIFIDYCVIQGLDRNKNDHTSNLNGENNCELSKRCIQKYTEIVTA